MLELLTVAGAAFTGLMFVLGLLPFRISARLMPLVASAAGYGCWELYAKLPVVLDSAAVAAGVAILSRHAVSQLPEPWSLDDALGWLMEHTPRRTKKVTLSADAWRQSAIPRL